MHVIKMELKVSYVCVGGGEGRRGVERVLSVPCPLVKMADEVLINKLRMSQLHSWKKKLKVESHVFSHQRLVQVWSSFESV